MRTHLTFFLLAISVLTYAQGFRVKLDTTGGVSLGSSLQMQSMASTGPGQYFAVGFTALSNDNLGNYTQRCYLTKFGCSSVESSSKRLSGGIFNVIRTVPGGGLIAGGSKSYYGNDMAYICRFNSALDTLSTVSFSQTASDRVYDICVAPDGSYVAGIISFGKVSIFRFSSAGMILWQKEIPYGAFGPPINQTVQLLSSGTNIYVGCTESNGTSDDIAIHRLDMTTGDETLHMTYGTVATHEVVRSMKWYAGKIVILTNIGSTQTGLIRLNSSLISELSLVFSGGQSLVGLELLTNNDGYSFIGGTLTESGVEYSVVWQVWNNGNVGWKQKLNEYSSVTADMVFEGPNIVVPTSGGMMQGFMMNYVNVSSGLTVGACESYNPPTINGGLYSIASTPHTNVTLLDAVFIESRGSVISPYSGVIDPCSIPLPVEELYFRASTEGQKVLLEWATATEHANDYYVVERSAVGDAFEEVARIDGAGDSQQVTEYSVYDENPLPGVSYYRLRQTDIDGTVSYSEMVPVEFEPSELLVPYPNPAVAGGEIRVNGFVTAYDGLGREVATGKNSIVLPVGTYFLVNALGQKATVIVQ